MNKSNTNRCGVSEKLILEEEREKDLRDRVQDETLECPYRMRKDKEYAMQQ